MMHGTQAHGGLVHEAVVYSSDDELVDAVVPFLHEGVEAGDPTLLAVGPDAQERILGCLGETGGVTVLAGDEYDRPLDALWRNHRRISEHVATGAVPVRMVGQVPAAEATWDGWVRYEAAFNHFCAELPAWGICAYDTRTATPRVLAEVRRTHPLLRTRDGARRANPDYTEPAAFLDERARREVDPLEHLPPDVEIANPTPARGRRAVSRLTGRSAIPAAAADSLVLAANEVVTNAMLHGQPPITLRGWSTDDRVVVTVHDHGDGPLDPYTGLRPASHNRSGGRGLWLANQLCSRVSLAGCREGFLVRLVAGTPVTPAPAGQPSNRPDCVPPAS